jgi:hypothetical protein
LRLWPRWARTLALAAAALMAAPAAVLADDPGGGDAGDRLIRIGPQMTLIENAEGQLRMYEDDPYQEAPECESSLGCWVNWVQLVAGVAIIAPRNITDGAELPGRNFRR